MFEYRVAEIPFEGLMFGSERGWLISILYMFAPPQKPPAEPSAIVWIHLGNWPGEPGDHSPPETNEDHAVQQEKIDNVRSADQLTPPE